MKRIDIATPEEVLESELAIIQGAGLKVKYIGYQKGLADDDGVHMYDLLEPKLPGYIYEGGGFPTLTLEGMRERGLI